jgi:hypothetical protein
VDRSDCDKLKSCPEIGLEGGRGKKKGRMKKQAN